MREVGPDMSVVQEVGNQLVQSHPGACHEMLNLDRGGANSNWRGIWIDVNDGSVWVKVEVASTRVDNLCVA